MISGAQESFVLGRADKSLPFHSIQSFSQDPVVLPCDSYALEKPHEASVRARDSARP
jgi:hypothetical protein